MLLFNNVLVLLVFKKSPQPATGATQFTLVNKLHNGCRAGGCPLQGSDGDFLATEDEKFNLPIIIKTLAILFSLIVFIIRGCYDGDYTCRL
jgi:hypothetical protein